MCRKKPLHVLPGMLTCTRCCVPAGSAVKENLALLVYDLVGKSWSTILLQTTPCAGSRVQRGARTAQACTTLLGEERMPLCILAHQIKGEYKPGLFTSSGTLQHSTCLSWSQPASTVEPVQVRHLRSCRSPVTLKPQESTTVSMPRSANCCGCSYVSITGTVAAAAALTAVDQQAWTGSFKLVSTSNILICYRLRLTLQRSSPEISMFPVNACMCSLAPFIQC